MSTAGNQFGRFFRQRRTALGLNLSEFCRRNGFDKGNISRLERGLTKPPASPDLLKTYAHALQLQPDSIEWSQFMERAADQRAAAIFEKPAPRPREPWLKAERLQEWSMTRAAQETLPTLVRHLIQATAEEPIRIEIPGGEGIQRHGWDGIVEVPKRSLFVPEGISAWEISVEQNTKQKAEKVFNDRKTGPLGLPSSKVTFVFVTSRKWDGKQKWRDEKRTLNRWKSVEVYDSSDLEAWLEGAPAVDAWIAERIGVRPPGVISIDDHWERLSHLSNPHLKPDVFLASRKQTAEELRKFLLGPPGVMAFECRSPIEAIDFVAAYLALRKREDDDVAMDEDERLRVRSRTVVVRDRAQWDGLSQVTTPVNLLPIPSLALTPEELAAAVSRGHRVLVAATHYANHHLDPLNLPRPSRYELESALSESGFERERAAKSARAAGGSLSVLKRHISSIPTSQSPRWCTEFEMSKFIPILLVGAWDESEEVDRFVLSRLSGTTYAEVQNVANRLSQADDPPLVRVESRWRLVSPEDSWALTGSHVTSDLLKLFETIAIEALGREDESLRLSSDERIMASINGTSEGKASVLLRRAISETVAILGAGFGPTAKFDYAQRTAAEIVHAVLHNASWVKWATLSDQLPLLAEAAPDQFLDSISADLKKNRPELARVLADGEDEHSLMSGCKHAGLLWALEGLAWSPELLSKVCAILAGLDELDSGQKWSNRPINSLRAILLARFPQTAAGVEKRIAVLKSLRDQRPAVAWKLLFAMVSRHRSIVNLTHRPVWRDWLGEWREGTSSADYLKEIEAAAELIVRLVDGDPSRWIEVIDELQSLPESYRDRLIDQLRTLPLNDIDPEARQTLAELLRKTIVRHRDFSDANWSLPEESVKALEEALARFIPDEICQRHAWLFAPWIDLQGFRGNYDKMQAQIEKLQAEAVRNILKAEGFDGILKLAEIVETPGRVGTTLARTKSIPDDMVVPELLNSSVTSHKLLAAAYAGVRIFDAGWDFVRSLPLSNWNASDAAVFLLQAGIDPQAWKLAESLGANVERGYWQNVAAHGGSHLSQQQLEYACLKLVKVDRPESAISMLLGVTFGNVVVSAHVVMDTLTAFLRWRQTNPDAELNNDTRHRIQRLFGWLQETIEFNDEEPTRRLGQLEWQFLTLLDGFGALPLTLIRRLSEEPEFFAELIALLFRSSDERESEAELSETQQRMAENGYRLLMNWTRIPGTRPDGSVNEESLLNWIETARGLCHDSGHLEVADSRIGEMLASWPQPNDEEAMWPCQEICDAIEEANSDDLDHGFQIGIYNGRGVTCRGPLDGGDLERREAAKYRRWAERCDADWPRTAASLRSVADGYERDAKREDARATERAQDRH